jgi:hypothetical protein
MGNIDEDPSFVNPTGGDYHLSKYSECINRGDPSYTAAPNETDMDGQPRIMLGQVDIGADEFTFNSVPTACITGGDRTIYTEEPVEVSVTLDGSCSDDIDSTPGTKDDITCFDWYKIDPCNPEIEEFIGCGEIMDCNLACGEHRIVLKTIDKAGTFDTDEVTIVVAIPKVEILIPQPNTALQDVVTLIAEISYLNDVDGLYFSIREPNMGNGITIGYDDIPGVFNSATNMWEYDFDTTQLYDGHYVIIAKAIDIYGYEVCSQVVPFSIRNWVLIDLLPSSRHNRAGRTVPIKFSLKTDKNIDATQPFVYNEDLMIKIFDTANPGDILQTSLFGDASKDYRIDTLNELYITNFKTLKTPAVYEVEIWRTNNNFLIGAFSFNTSIVDRGDFTGDGITDFDDLIIMTENWLGNEKTVDIDPYPNGDGMVNFMDFAVLAQHWMDSP